MKATKYGNLTYQNIQKDYYKNIFSPMINDTKKMPSTDRLLDNESDKFRKLINLININPQKNLDLDKNQPDLSKNNFQNFLNDSPRFQNSICSNLTENNMNDLPNNVNKKNHINTPLNDFHKKNAVKTQGNTKRSYIEKNYKNNYKKSHSFSKPSKKSNPKEIKNNNIDKSDLSLSLIKMSYSTLCGNEFADNSFSIREINSIITCNNNKNKKIKNDNNLKGLLNANQQPIIINDSNCHNYYNSFFLKEGYIDKNLFVENLNNKNKSIDERNSKILTRLYKNAIIISMRHLQKFCKLHLKKIFTKFFNILKNYRNKKTNKIYRRKTPKNNKKCQYFSPKNINSPPKISNYCNGFSENIKKNLYKNENARKSYDVFLKNCKSSSKKNNNEHNNIYIKKRTIHKSIEPKKLNFVDEKINNGQNKFLYKSTNNKYFTLQKESSEEKEKEENLLNNNENQMFCITDDKKINICIHIIPYKVNNNSNIIKYENLGIIYNENINIQSEKAKKKLRLKTKVFHKIIKYLRRKIKYNYLLSILTLLKKKYFKYFLTKLINIKQVNNISIIKHNSNKFLLQVQESEKYKSDSKPIKNQRYLSCSSNKNKTRVVRIKKIKIIESTINEIIPKSMSQDNKKLCNNKNNINKIKNKDNEYNYRKKFLLKKFVIATNKKNYIKKYFQNWLDKLKSDIKKININEDKSSNINNSINNDNFDNNINTDEDFPTILNDNKKIIIEKKINANETKEFMEDLISILRTNLILFVFKFKHLNNNSQ